MKKITLILIPFILFSCGEWKRIVSEKYVEVPVVVNKAYHPAYTYTTYSKMGKVMTYHTHYVPQRWEVIMEYHRGVDGWGNLVVDQKDSENIDRDLWRSLDADTPLPQFTKYIVKTDDFFREKKEEDFTRSKERPNSFWKVGFKTFQKEEVGKKMIEGWD